MLARLGAAGADAIAVRVHRVAGLALPLAYTTVVVVAVTEVRDINAADRDADQVLAFLAQQLAARQEPPQIVTDFALDDLAEALMVLMYPQRHVIKPKTAETQR